MRMCLSSEKSATSRFSRAFSSSSDRSCRSSLTPRWAYFSSRCRTSLHSHPTVRATSLFLGRRHPCSGQARGIPQCLLVIIGATPEGKKELVGLIHGVRESAQSWKELLLDLKRRGLAIGPELAVADGALGFWQAIEEVWPKTRGQRCWVHKTANVLNKLPNSQQSKAKRALQEIWMAETKKDALAVFDSFVETWGVKYDKAVECLIKDRDALLAFYDFPAEHWKHLRTTNVIESSFATVRHRTVRSKGCLSNKTALAMIFKLAEAAERNWRVSTVTTSCRTHSRCKVHRRNRGRQIASSSRCRLIPSVTKIWL